MGDNLLKLIAGIVLCVFSSLAIFAIIVVMTMGFVEPGRYTLAAGVLIVSFALVLFFGIELITARETKDDE